MARRRTLALVIGGMTLAGGISALLYYGMVAGAITAATVATVVVPLIILLIVIFTIGMMFHSRSRHQQLNLIPDDREHSSHRGLLNALALSQSEGKNLDNGLPEKPKQHPSPIAAPKQSPAKTDVAQQTVTPVEEALTQYGM